MLQILALKNFQYEALKRFTLLNMSVRSNNATQTVVLLYTNYKYDKLLISLKNNYRPQNERDGRSTEVLTNRVQQSWENQAEIFR